jgi:GDPmannose 4,6-dehydratase
MVRGQNNPKQDFVSNLIPNLEFVDGDILDQSSLIAALEYTQPDEVYNLAAISFVGLSWAQAVLTGEITGLGVIRLLEAIRIVNKDIKFYQASSSEMFGKVREIPQTESTPFYPRSPYGAAKAYGHHITVNYRESHEIFACSGILFNHESPRRGLEFVTRKVTNSVARIKQGKQKELILGNLDSQRDWGYAGDYVDAMWRMLQQQEPCDYVISTNKVHSIKELCEIAFSRVGLDWNKYVKTDKKFLRPAEVDFLQGDYTFAKKNINWQPKVDFKSLIEMMVDSDMRLVNGENPVEVLKNPLISN